MCIQCMIGAMSAGAGATGARSWIATRHFVWLTPVRLRRITGALLALALIASTLLVSGSTPLGAAHAASAAGAHR
ncbi:MAG: hypothetical protein ACR2ND_08080 [Solirubrobacteraceae bacterium]